MKLPTNRISNFSEGGDGQFPRAPHSVHQEAGRGREQQGRHVGEGRDEAILKEERDSLKPFRRLRTRKILLKQTHP